MFCYTPILGISELLHIFGQRIYISVEKIKDMKIETLLFSEIILNYKII